VENGQFVGWGSKAVYSVWEGTANVDRGDTPYARSVNDPHIAVSRDPDSGWVTVHNSQTGVNSTTNYQGIPDLWTSSPFTPAIGQQNAANGAAVSGDRGGDAAGYSNSGLTGGNGFDGYGSTAPTGGFNDYNGYGYTAYDNGDSDGAAKPILLDLDGDGVEVAAGAENFVPFAVDDAGLTHRSAWAGAGDAVLFFDPDGRDTITESRQFVFTEWDPTAADDMAALRAVFDTNHDGKLTAADAEFAKFKLMATGADGSTSVVTLAEAGIVAIDLQPDATFIELPDGSFLSGQASFTRANGVTGLVANAGLSQEAAGYRVAQESSTDASGNHVVDTDAYLAGGADEVMLGIICKLEGTLPGTSNRAKAG
jgi:hypothetical protein